MPDKIIDTSKMASLSDAEQIVEDQGLLQKSAETPKLEGATIDFSGEEFSEAPGQADPDDASISHAAKDLLINGVAGGVEQAGRGLVETGATLGKHLLPPGLRDALSDKPVLGEPMIDQPEGLPAQILRDVTQFGIGLVGGMGALKGATALGMGAKEILGSALGTGAVADPNAPRLANLIEQHPYLKNPITDYLAASPDDSVAEGKFKSALEDMMVTPVAMVLMKAVKAMKLFKSGDADGAAKLTDEVAEDVKLAQMEKDALEVPEVTVTPDNAAPEPVKTPEEIAAADAKAAKEYSDLAKITKGGDLYTKLDPAERATMDAHLAENPDSTFKLSLGKDGQVRAFKNAVVINDKAGKPMFSLTDDELTQFQKHVDYMVSQNHLEDIFNFPEFSLFNARRSAAGYDTQEVLSQMWSLVEPKVNKVMDETRRHEETLKFANVLGEDPAALRGNIKLIAAHAADMDKYLVAGKALLYDMAREARSLATRVNFGTATPEEMKSLSFLQENMADLMGSVTALRKGAARTTSAGKITTGNQFNESAMEQMAKDAQTSGDVRKFAERLALAGDDPTDIIRAVKGETLLKKLIDAHNEYLISNLLFIKTNLVNITSAVSNNFLLPMNKIVGGAITGSKEDVAEGLATYRGLRTHFFDAWEMAKRSFKAEDAILDTKVGSGSAEQKSVKSISSENFDLDPSSWFGKSIDVLGKAARINTRFLTAEDEFFKQISYRAKLSAMAAREAADLVKAGTLDPNKQVTAAVGGNLQKISEVEKYIQDKFQAAFSPNGAGTDPAALKYAREITFTQDLKDLKTWAGNPGAELQRMVTNVPLLRGTLLPFVKVPTNLMRATADYTPGLGQLKRQFWDDINSGDPSRKSDAVGKAMMGLGFWTGAAFLAMEGGITGAAYGDKDMRQRQEEDPNWQAYSFVIPMSDGTKRYVAMNRLDPFFNFFSIAADYHYLAGHLSDDEKHNLATSMTLAIARNVTSKSYLQGLTEQLSILGGGYTAADHAEKFFNTKLASYIPAPIAGLAGNDELKEIRSVMDALLAKTPFYSSTVEAKRDYFGEKRNTPDGYPWNVINPFPVKGGESDPVREELARLARSKVEAKFAAPDKMMGTLDLTSITNSKGQTAYDRMQELMQTVTDGKGQTFYNTLKEMIGSDAYKNEWNDGTTAYHAGKRVVQIRQEADKFHALAERAMKKEFSAEYEAGKITQDIMAMTRQDKRNVNAVKHGHEDKVQNIMELTQ